MRVDLAQGPCYMWMVILQYGGVASLLQASCVLILRRGHAFIWAIVGWRSFFASRHMAVWCRVEGTVAILAQGTPRGDAFYAALLLLLQVRVSEEAE